MNEVNKIIALSATFTALVFVATIIFYMAIFATNGFFNLGESMVYLSALVGGPIVGLIAGGLGSALADMALGYGVYAPATLILKGSEGFVAGYLYLKLKNVQQNNIKIIYILFSVVFIGLSIVLTSPSLFNVIFGLNFGSITTIFNDLGAEVFTIAFVLFLPSSEGLTPQEFTFDFSGVFLILLSILFTLLIWLTYSKMGDKSPMIISCAVSGLIIIFGYFSFQTLFLDYTITQAFAEMPFSILQVFIGMSIAIPTVSYLQSVGSIPSK